MTERKKICEVEAASKILKQRFCLYAQLLRAASRFSSGFSAAAEAEASPMADDGTEANCAEISRPDSSATCLIKSSTWLTGVDVVVAVPIASSITLKSRHMT